MTFIVILVYQDLPHSWPPFVREIINSLSIMNFNLDVLAPECAVGDGYTKYILKLLFPLSFPAIFVFFYLLTKIQMFIVVKFGAGVYVLI
jgi:hypothetical protein